MAIRNEHAREHHSMKRILILVKEEVKEDTHASSKRMKKMKEPNERKKEDTHASSIVLQVTGQYCPVGAGLACLDWSYATTQKSPGLARRHTLLPLYLAMCTTRLPVWQGC